MSLKKHIEDVLQWKIPSPNVFYSESNNCNGARGSATARNVLHLDLNAIPTVANPPGLAADGDLEAGRLKRLATAWESWWVES